MTKHLVNKDKQKLFRIYKSNNNANFIAEKSGYDYGTVRKVIKEERFKERFDMIKETALQIVDQKQANMLALNIMDLCNIEDMIKESLVANPEREFSVTDLDKIIRLKYHLLGMPDSTIKHVDSSIEVQQVKRADVIDAEYENEN